MTLVDTPDYQRGLVSAQKLLATVAAGVGNVTVGIPPNAETLVVTLAGVGGPGGLICKGTVSEVQYPWQLTHSPAFDPTSRTFLIDVSDVIDSQVEITMDSAPAGEWYVYTDSGVHNVAEMSFNRDANGSIFTVPVIPYGQPGSHPPQELSIKSSLFFAAGDVINAPGVGNRLRIFSLFMLGYGSATIGFVEDSVSGESLLWSASLVSASLHLPPQGYAMSANAALHFAYNTGTGGVAITAYYTVETV